MQTKSSVRLGWQWAGFRVLLMLCLRSAQVHGQDPTSSGIEILHVHGLVVDAVTHTPIGRALVTTADQRMAVLADGGGRFEFDVKRTSSPIPGDRSRTQERVVETSVSLLARKPSYRNMQRPVVLSLEDVEALKGEVQLKLVPLAVLMGRVTASGAETPVGVPVQLTRRQVQDGTAVWQAMQIVQTNIRGEYRFAEVVPGDYRIVTREWVERVGRMLPAAGRSTIGYPPITYPHTSDKAPGEMHVTGGQTVEADLHLHAVPYYPVAIPIANKAITDSVNVVVRSEQAGDGLSLGFNQQTQEIEGALPDGVYHLQLASYGEQADPGKPPQIKFGLGELTVTGKPVRGATIPLEPGATLPVTVREEYTSVDPRLQGAQGGSSNWGIRDGSGVAPSEGGQNTGSPTVRQRSVEVFLQAKDANAGGAALSNPLPGSSGNEGLVIENVSPGSYRVAVTPRRGYASSVTANGVDLLQQPLVIEGGASPTIEIVLRDDTATVSGTVSRERGKRPAGARDLLFVWAYPIDGRSGPGNVMQSFTTPEGKFVMNGLAPGRYLLLPATLPLQNIEYRNEEALRTLPPTGKIVTLGPGQTLNVALTAPPEGRLAEEEIN